jgi:hypothetical protein
MIEPTRMQLLTTNGEVGLALTEALFRIDRLEAALRNLIAAMDDNPSPNGICDWSDGEHKAVEQARDILGVVSDS